ncbi:MAG: hypothetical protein WC455_15560 [Dehalococcoidia bacterium]
MEMTENKCPGCGAANPTTEHLLAEYKDLTRHGFGNMFGINARKSCNAVVDMLVMRGCTFYWDIFGKHTLTKWTY